MAKQTINKKQTSVQQGNQVGMQIETTFAVEDNILPSPTELEAYAKIDHTIVESLLSMAQKEQEHRHNTDIEKIQLVNKSEKRVHQQNMLGMILVTLLILAQLFITALGVILDKPWITGIFGATSLATIATIFIKKK